jgi:hypothetical protein
MKCDASNVENSRRAIPDFIVLRSRHPGGREGKRGCFWLSKSTIRRGASRTLPRAVHLTWAFKHSGISAKGESPLGCLYTHFYR